MAALKFSIAAIVGADKASCSPSTCDAAAEATAAVDGGDDGSRRCQSWFDVFSPHVRMASTNPHLVGVAPPSSLGQAEAALTLHHQRLWSQQWVELLQQAGQARFFNGDPAAGLFLTPFRKPKRVRTAFSGAQLQQLEDAFDDNHYVIGAERKQLALRLQLSETQLQIKVWFQNRRTKEKRIKSDEEAKSSKAEPTAPNSPPVGVHVADAVLARE